MGESRISWIISEMIHEILLSPIMDIEKIVLQDKKFLFRSPFNNAAP